MKNRIFSTCLILWVCSVCLHAETVRLKTGATVRGEIVFQNEEVVIVRNADGRKLQYLKSDVESILNDTEEAAAVAEQAEQVQKSKRVSVSVEIGGGGAVCPKHAEMNGGAISADLLVGTHHIQDSPILLGGSFGLRSVLGKDGKHMYLPLQLVVRAPLVQQKHAPVLGMSMGYSFATSKEEKGGLIAGANVGYRCQANDKLAVELLADVTWLQAASVKATEQVGDDLYISHSAAHWVSVGLKLGLVF